MKKLELEKQIDNPSCKDGALYILNEYINVKLIDASQIVILTSFLYFLAY